MYTFRNWVFTKVALGELIATAIVSLICLFLAISVYYDIRFYIAYHRALAAYAGSHLEIAVPQINSALRFRPDFAPARELAAKMMIDGVTSNVKSTETLAEAEKLLQSNLGRAGRTSPATLLALAVIHLKRVDIAKANKQAVDPEIKEAEEALSAAESADSDNVDVTILRAHLAFRKGTPEDRKEAEELLAKAEERMKGSQSVKDLPSIDCMMDLYVGQMVINASKGDWAAARQSAQRILLLRPGWDLPNANMASLEARRFVTDKTIRREELERRSTEINDLTSKLMGIYSRNQDDNKYAQEAAYSLRQSFALAYGNLGDTTNLNYLMSEVRSIDDKRATSYLNMIDCFMRNSRRENLTEAEREGLKAQARGFYGTLYKLDMTPARKVTICNNMGWMSIDGDRNQSFEYFRQAMEWADKNKLKCPVVKRNLAVWNFGGDKSEEAMKIGRASMEDDPTQTDLDEWLKKLGK